MRAHFIKDKNSRRYSGYDVLDFLIDSIIYAAILSLKKECRENWMIFHEIKWETNSNELLF